jgi:ATP-dependent Clp protease ATP-binding subunit ClpA
MKSNVVSIGRRSVAEPETRLTELLTRKVVGQQTAIEAIVPYVMMYQAGLAPEGRPVGVFLLLGPTGTGKTRTVEALADVLHGNERNLLRIDCGEYQMDHEVAKLIGAPPGYLGHRETHPLLTQQRLNAVTSDKSGLSLVLFDEIEKAAPSLSRLLLGVLDKGLLRLGDNTTVNFANSLIFLTSNLGAREMNRAMQRGVGFAGLVPNEVSTRRLDAIANAAVRRRFSPEFVNRIDVSVTYHKLSHAAVRQILDIQLEDLQRHIYSRLGPRAFRLEATAGARDFLLKNGASDEFGARQLKRSIHRHLTQPLAALVAGGMVPPSCCVRVKAAKTGDSLVLEPACPSTLSEAA